MSQSGYGAAAGLTNEEGVQIPGTRSGALAFSRGVAVSKVGVEGRVGAAAVRRRRREKQ